MTGDMEKKYPIPSDVRMYTREEVAEIIGCHKNHVVMLSEVGCLSCIRIGKRYMYSYEFIRGNKKISARL